jgi:hypothetical protein
VLFYVLFYLVFYLLFYVPFYLEIKPPFYVLFYLVVGLRFVGFRLGDKEYQALAERARKEGVTVSEFIRRAVLAALGLPAPAQPEVGDRLSALEKRVGELEERVLALEQAASQGLPTSTTAKAAAGTGNVAGGSGGVRGTAQSKVRPREGERVKIISLEWARQKGVNTEEYMARREREGYICNEADRKIYCIWREDIEQLVVDLNSAGARMGELDRVLNGERLETAEAAVEAGLMWYDNREKRWRAPL